MRGTILTTPIHPDRAPTVSPSDNKRTYRVGELLREELAALLVEGVRDPRVGFVTVTEVRPTPDLREARVYVSVYGSEDEQQRTMAGLKDASGFLQRELGRKIRLKYVPELVFVVDDTLLQAARIDALIGAATGGEQDVPHEVSVETAPVATSRTDREAKRAEMQLEIPRPERTSRKGSRSRDRRRR